MYEYVKVEGDADYPEPRFRFDSHYSIIISALIWTLVYEIIVRLLPTKSVEYCGRILCFLHGLITAFIGTEQCFLIDNPYNHPEWRTVPLQKFLMVFSLGYFIHDLRWCVQYDRNQKLMLAHHVYSCCALYRMLFKTYSGAQTTCALGCMEISNPLLQLRWFLRSEGFYPSVVYTSVEITFMIVFVLVRIILGTYFLVVITFQPKNEWDFRILAATIYIMSWIFLFNIVKYFMTKYAGFRLVLEEINSKGT